MLFLLGSVAFKLRVIHGLWERRLVAALAVLGAGLLGTVVPALGIWTLTVAILGVLAAAEAAVLRPAGASRARHPAPRI